MKLSPGGLRSLCEVNVVELKFTRRNQKPGKSPTRRMLATLDADLLNSKEGLSILNFKPPTSAPAYNAESRGLLVVWDIFLQTWRSVPAAGCEIISLIPTRPVEKFWDHFNSSIGNMNAGQKAAFHDK